MNLAPQPNRSSRDPTHSQVVIVPNARRSADLAHLVSVIDNRLGAMIQYALVDNRIRTGWGSFKLVGRDMACT